MSISNIIERSPFGDSVTITVPTSGQHHGRNGYARIKALQIWYRRNGTVFLDSINSRDTVTVGGFHNVPVADLLRLLEQLKAEAEKGFPPTEETGDSLK